MLRINFSSEELNRLRVAPGPDPLWETVLSLQLLQNRQAALTFDPWRHEVRARLARHGLTGTARALMRLCPHAVYFPDFLTPAPSPTTTTGTGTLGAGGPAGTAAGTGAGTATGGSGSPGTLRAAGTGTATATATDTSTDTGTGGRPRPGPGPSPDPFLDPLLDRVLSTPKSRLSREVSLVYAERAGHLPPDARRIAEGDPGALHRLGEALRRYYAVAVEPYLPAVLSAAAADRSVRAEAMLHGGPGGLLRSYGSQPGWRPARDALHAPYPLRRELRLHGRPLTLIPAFFCTRAPVALADESLAPVLVYPLSPAPGWLARGTGHGTGHGSAHDMGRGTGGDPYGQGAAQRPCADEGRQGGEEAPLGQLIGVSRAQLLDALDRPMTTGELATVLRLAPSTASRHTSVLREAGLITSRRQGNSVRHERTSLGGALLDGA